MNITKYAFVSVVYVVIVQCINGFLEGSVAAFSTDGGYAFLQFLKYVAFIVPMIVIAVKALKINNLYNVRRFALRAWKKYFVAVIIFICILSLIVINCDAGDNWIRIFEMQYDITDPVALLIAHNIFDDISSEIFVVLLTMARISQIYNKPLTGNER